MTDSTVYVGNSSHVIAAEVGLRIDHFRVSDLAITLVSPSGTRVLLDENRGGLDTNGFGAGINITNVFPRSASGSYQPDYEHYIGPVTNAGTLIVSYDMHSIPDDMRVYYDGVLIYDTGFGSRDQYVFQSILAPEWTLNVSHRDE